MSMNLPTLDHERRFFTRFCAAAGLEPLEGSIEEPERNPPDRRAQLRGYDGPTAFELVRLNDPDDLRTKRRVAPGDQLFKTSFAALEASRCAALKAKFADCAITISFSGTETDAARKDALAFLWQLLDDLPASMMVRCALSTSRLVEALQAGAIVEGSTPLDYLLKAMRTPIPERAWLKVKIAAHTLRMEAAKAAAPYVHPRLASIEVSNHSWPRRRLQG
jgi:hypothetical protein